MTCTMSERLFHKILGGHSKWLLRQGPLNTALPGVIMNVEPGSYLCMVSACQGIASPQPPARPLLQVSNKQMPLLTISALSYRHNTLESRPTNIRQAQILSNRSVTRCSYQILACCGPHTPACVVVWYAVISAPHDVDGRKITPIDSTRVP